jgi:hypothetical protein
MLGTHQLQRHLICLVDRSLLPLGEYVLARNQLLMPSVSNVPESPTSAPGEQAVITGDRNVGLLVLAVMDAVD